ncbi:hypothetical protein F6V25_05175 [Oryzomonas japonica]|uniref:DUF2523 domain-containing protein n=1 Tax=Oryzomonas japonica TaxID=2603858 RepID=A0A7J4ZTN7_9BACT|nr:hypothetical protein [Oryzomonas japonica]KAB0666808.1 hypothetical protein F6V25_05175 [Oryzomonas japonica]
MQVLLTFLGSVLGKIFTDGVIKWIAVKTLSVFLFTTVVPIILNNFLYDIIEIVLNFATSQIGSSGSLNGAMSFDGLLGWFVTVFRVPECLSVLISALVLRVILSMIPFVRLAG